jgi:glycosyltransferase involved in cell wall biosynthesis
VSATERLFLLTERALARRTTYFFTQAQHDGPRAVALGIARSADMLVIGNGVDVQRFSPGPAARERTRRDLGVADDAIVVVAVARLVREKGLLDLADAALRAPDRRLHYAIVGDALPSDRTGIAAELDSHPVVRALGPRWHRLGHRTDVEEVLRAADVFVLPSYREGLPRSIIEAMSTGIPVVASDIPACRELVREGETGLLVPLADPVRLADAISQLATDPEARRLMGERARAVTLAEHDERRIVAQQLDVYRRLLTR